MREILNPNLNHKVCKRVSLLAKVMSFESKMICKGVKFCGFVTKGICLSLDFRDFENVTEITANSVLVFLIPWRAVDSLALEGHPQR